MMTIFQQTLKVHSYNPPVLTSNIYPQLPSKFRICFWVLCDPGGSLLQIDDNSVHLMLPSSTFQSPASLLSQMPYNLLKLRGLPQDPAEVWKCWSYRKNRHFVFNWALSLLRNLSTLRTTTVATLCLSLYNFRMGRKIPAFLERNL